MSFDSSRSSHSHDSESSKKTKRKSLVDSNSSKSRQKTLGMSWGSNSRASSKFSARKAPFANFGSYMEAKNRKLQHQFDADASTSSVGGSNVGNGLFHGISIFVDGFTVPSSQELREYMLKHGGRFENYFSRHYVTHIICSNLPDSKIRNLRSFSGGLPIVKPTWVLDCVAANKVLSWAPYQLEQLSNGTHNQQTLSAFFSPKNNLSFNNAETCMNFHEELEMESSFPKVKANNNALLIEAGEYSEPKSASGEESICHGASHGVRISDSDSDSHSLEDGHNIKEAFHSSPESPSATGSSHDLHDKNTKEQLHCKEHKLQHSTRGDPNFVENYFKMSRLHFIGTWRSRYRKRFAHLEGFKDKNPKFDAHTAAERSTIIHVDMDCFFVSVNLRNHPELLDKPVAVCHSENPKGTAEISSANYPARDYGVKAGMFVRDAKALCPHLVIFPYNFRAYEEVADEFYNILHKHCKKVQAVSCDEAYLDVTELGTDNPELIASGIRHDIFVATGCTASAGISGNRLMARLATRTAKPNGQYSIPSEKVDDYLKNLPIKALPGVGYALAEKLKHLDIQTCGQLRMVSKEKLRKDLGMKTGDMLWNYSRGIDNQPVEMIKETKSIGAEVNWGVRLNNQQDSQDFLTKLCKEVSLRLQGYGMQGRTITLKVKKRRKGAEEPQKYMGCGSCENLSHSMTIPAATCDADVLQRICKHLFVSFCINVKEIRGVGLQVSRLESAASAKQGGIQIIFLLLFEILKNIGEIPAVSLNFLVNHIWIAACLCCFEGHEKTTLKSWIASASETTEQPWKTICAEKVSTDGDASLHSGQNGSNFNPQRKPVFCQNSVQLDHTGASSSHVNQSSAEASDLSTVPPMEHLDLNMIESLPQEIFSEINEMYNGKLVSFMKMNKEKNHKIGTTCKTLDREFGESNSSTGNKGKEPFHSLLIHEDNVPTKSEVRDVLLQDVQPASSLRSSEKHFTDVRVQQSDLMPTSLSQVDISVLQELPEELKTNVIEFLPPHRESNTSGSGFALESLHSMTQAKEKSITDLGFNSKQNLWTGDPPKWAEDFKISNCRLLKILSKLYQASRPSSHLSSILQGAFSSLPRSPGLDGEDSGDALSSFCELLKQYIEIKIDSDIEEIYSCFRLMKRFSTKSLFILQAYNIVLPSLQAYVRESYGGSLWLAHEHE